MSEDNIFREVDEEMRREQIAAVWDRYGVYVLAVALLIVLSVGGYNIYNWWQAGQAAENGAALYQATRLVEENKPAEAQEAFARIAGNGPAGYRALADLDLAAIHAGEGRKAEAVALYEKVAGGGADSTLRDYARLQAAALRLDDADRAEITRRLERLNADTNPWRYSARELLGLAAFRSGDTAESEKIFSQLFADLAAPPQIRERAQSMLALLVKSPQTTGAAAPDPAAKTAGETQ